MLSYIWPIALLVLSNTIYQICSKSVPSGLNPLASVTVTYLVAAGFSMLLYFFTEKNANILQEYHNLNWAPFTLGFVIVGLEVGFIYAYRAGWQISMASIVQSAFLAVVLIAVGYFLYHEPITWNKLIGIVLCLAGLVFINKH